MLEKTLEYFRKISKIPRCSWNEEKIVEFLINWAGENNYKYRQDKIWNVLIVIPATKWMEKKETIILQWHLDMVCIKWTNSNHDFLNDPIEIIEENWFLRANDTTLWADNGIWVAIILASASFEKHPKLELFFTIAEEIWLIWAFNMELNFLSWKKLINLDNDKELEIIIWSAGWTRIKIENKLELEEWKLNKFKINISWLKWWHSWIEIDNSKWNAIDCLMQLLEKIWWEIEFYNIVSWFADNAIPSDLETIIWIEKNENIEEKLFEFLKEYIYKYQEKWLQIKIKKIDFEWKTIWKEKSNILKKSILSCYSWVYSYSKIIDWFVQTSQNLWILKLENWNLLVIYLIRSFDEKEINNLIKQKKRYFWKIAEVILDNTYSGWIEDKNSYLLKQVLWIYKNITNWEIKINVVHAWLECWAIISKMKQWSEAVCIWPNMFWIHTINEKCEIKSIWVLLKVLERFLTEI